MNYYYDHFIIPFIIGVTILFAVVIYKYVRWVSRLPKSDKESIRKGIFSLATFGAVGEIFSESLLHRRIFRVNPLLGYMHMSLAFGWFLLIAVGWIEASIHLKGEIIPLHAHVFYKFFAPEMVNTASSKFLEFTMDFLLLMVLSGVALAYGKRLYSKMMGMRRTTKHTLGDKVALTALWMVFPARLIAESVTSGIRGSESFLTGSFGGFLIEHLGWNTMVAIAPYTWWLYSTVLAVFFVAMPFSRYMHIFTEIPLIFLRRYKIKSSQTTQNSFDHFQIEACSRCGICIDPCQLQSATGIDNVQSVYFLRDRRYNMLDQSVTDNCLLCGRCDAKCPVGIDLSTLRLNSRSHRANVPADGRYTYLKGADKSSGEGRVGYFAGCMTLLTPKVLRAMDKIFDAAGEQVWYADKDGGVCCGRPLKLSGEIDASLKMVDYNKALFAQHGITTLVTSCPICLRTFKEDYNLKGIEVLHHSEYILRMINKNKLKPQFGQEVFTYHDPCELGRGLGVYDEPRAVLDCVGTIVEMEHNRRDALCCGDSLANIEINDVQQIAIESQVGAECRKTGADVVVTSCPLCKKALQRGGAGKVCDLSEVVAGALV